MIKNPGIIIDRIHCCCYDNIPTFTRTIGAIKLIFIFSNTGIASITIIITRWIVSITTSTRDINAGSPFYTPTMAFCFKIAIAAISKNFKIISHFHGIPALKRVFSFPWVRIRNFPTSIKHTPTSIVVSHCSRINMHVIKKENFPTYGTRVISHVVSPAERRNFAA